MSTARKVTAAIFAIILVAVTVLGTNIFGGDKVSPTVLPTVSAVAGQTPTISAPEGAAPTELTTKDIIVGTGAEVLPTSTLTVHYTLMAWSTGKIIESSWSGQPATFPLAQVVEGWQKGLPGAKVGGRRLLVLPPSMGYGAAGAGPIGPNETLIFVVDIIGVA
jgi:peptidylprolyl isomerase